MVIDLSVENPGRMLYYVAMATVGSLAGCIWLYLLAKKGGEALFRKHAGLHAERTQRWVRRNAFMTMFISSILPPPLPLFKVVVLAEGMFQVRLSTFVMALVLGRGVRFLIEGVLGVRYGRAALVFMEAHRIAFVGWGLASLVALWLIAKIALRERESQAGEKV